MVLLETRETSLSVKKQALIPNSDWLQSASLVYYKPNAIMKMHSHSLSEVSLMLAGQSVESDLDGSDIDLDLRPRFKPIDYRHSVKFGPSGALFLAIKFKRELETLGGSNKTGVLNSGQSNLITKTYSQRLVRSLITEVLDQEALEDSISEFVTTAQPANYSNLRKKPPKWIIESKEMLEDTSLTINEIAKHADVHRVYLTRVFQEYYCMTPSQFRKCFKLGMGVRRLLQGNHKVTDVAFQSGYSDHSHFARELRLATGVSPTTLKESILST